MDASLEEYVASITVPEDEWNEARDWLIETRKGDALRAIADHWASSCGQLMNMPDGRRISVTNLQYVLACCKRDDRDAREWVEDAKTLRRMLEAAESGRPTSEV